MGLSQLSRSVSGARVLITGAGSGMGRATARLFADEGARVFLADWDRKGVEAVTAEIQAMYGPDSAACLSGDVANQSDRELLILAAIKFMRGIDILVNNAGVFEENPITRADAEWLGSWDRTMQINLTASADLCRRAVLHWQASGASGRIVNIASRAAYRGDSPAHWHYAASKAGIIGFTKSVALELGSRNIRCNAVAPGFIETEMTEALDEKTVQGWRDAIPMKRGGQPQEIADACVFLGSDMSSYISGQVLHVNGAMYT